MQRRAEVVVLEQFGQFHPGLDLLGLGVVGQQRGQGAGDRREGGVVVQAVEDGAEEVVDQVPALGFRETGELVHEVLLIHFIRGRAAPDDRRQHGAALPQDADLHIQCLGVRLRDVRQRDLPVQHPAYRGQVDSQLAQGAYEVDARDGIGAVPAVSGRGAVGRWYESGVRVEPDGLDGQTRPSCQLTD